MDLYFTGALPAHQFCVISYWAAKAGVTAAQAYGLKPGASLGNYQRHLNLTLGFQEREGDLYTLSLPRHSAHAPSRS